MKVLSVNLAKPREITLNAKKRLTGMYKKPVLEPITLTKHGVEKDIVADKENHGGWSKAVYLYGKNNYAFFKDSYPELAFDNGLFGENITISNLDETNVYIGDEYKMGNAIIKITEPRLPCDTLGYRFGTQKIVKHFMKSTFCGAYCSVIKEGEVKYNDTLKLIKRPKNSLSLAMVYSIYSENKNNNDLIKKIIKLKDLPNSYKAKFRKKRNEKYFIYRIGKRVFKWLRNK